MTTNTKTTAKTIEDARRYFEAHPDAGVTLGHVSRMTNELIELDTRTEALHKFTDTDIYRGLEAEERTDMYNQWRYMANYRVVLARRLQRALDKAA